MELARRLASEARRLDAAADLVGDARFALLGEASHGTAEFYDERARITLELLASGRCDAVALEADWPDAWRVGCHTRGATVDLDPLGAFERFPRWMWRNEQFAAFVERLRGTGAGVYGLDLYSLFGSMRAVVSTLAAVDREAADRARERYACFDHVAAADARAYGMGAAFGAGESCEDAAVAQLLVLLQLPEEGDDAVFSAERNAAVVAGAAFHLGFTTSVGTVAAADAWDGAARTKNVRPPPDGSCEALLSAVSTDPFVLDLREGEAAEAFAETRLERAIGVIYRPQTERVSHWFDARMAGQLDAVAHVHETTAVVPLDAAAEEGADAPETWPSGV